MTSRDDLLANTVAGLRKAADDQDAGNLAALGDGFTALEVAIAKYNGANLALLRDIYTFWDEWVDARNHDWRYYPFQPHEWPLMARSIADDISRGASISNQKWLAHLSHLHRKPLWRKLKDLFQ